MTFFRRKSPTDKEKEQKEEELRRKLFERLDARRGIIRKDPQAEATYHSNLMMVGAHLAQGCHPNGAAPEEMVATYTRVMDGLMDWFNIVPVREQLDPMLSKEIFTKWEYETPLRSFYEPTLKKAGKMAIPNTNGIEHK